MGGDAKSVGRTFGDGRRLGDSYGCARQQASSAASAPLEGEKHRKAADRETVQQWPRRRKVGRRVMRGYNGGNGREGMECGSARPRRWWDGRQRRRKWRVGRDVVASVNLPRLHVTPFALPHSTPTRAVSMRSGRADPSTTPCKPRPNCHLPASSWVILPIRQQKRDTTQKVEGQRLPYVQPST